MRHPLERAGDSVVLLYSEWGSGLLSIDFEQHFVLGNTDCKVLLLSSSIVILMICIISKKAGQLLTRSHLACRLGIQRYTVILVPSRTRDTQRLGIPVDMVIPHLRSFRSIHLADVVMVRMDNAAIMTLISQVRAAQDGHDHPHLTTRLLSLCRHSVSV